MTSEEILAYWTPENIRSAIPFEEFLKKSKSEKQKPVAAAKGDDVSPRGQLVPTVVPKEKLTTFPYQCVGRLYFTIKGTRTWISAHHVGANRLLTVAHALVVSGSKPGEWVFAELLGFIPAMVNYQDEFGMNYGTYPQIPGGPGQAYFPNNHFNPDDRKADFDICTVFLNKGSTGKYISEVLPPIQLLINLNYTPQAEWNCIGYPDPAVSKDGEMYEISGKFAKKVDTTVQKYGFTPPGMSGGPWILKDSNNRGNGIQAGNVDDTTTISPYFRDGLIPALAEVEEKL